MPRTRDPRGPRQRQDAFCLPVLLEMAAVGGIVHTRGANAKTFSNTAHILARVHSYFEFSSAEKVAKYPSGKNVLEWDVRYAIDALDSDGHILREPRQQYSVTNAGFGKLQAFLAHMPEVKTSNARVLRSTGYAGDELLVAVLKLVDSAEELIDCVVSASDQISLYRAALKRLPNRSLTKLCADFQVAIRSLLAHHNAKTYGFTARL